LSQTKNTAAGGNGGWIGSKTHIDPKDYVNRIRIDTLLFIASHYLSQPDKFEEILLCYPHKHQDWNDARDNLRTHVVEKLGAEKVSVKYNTKKSSRRI